MIKGEMNRRTIINGLDKSYLTSKEKGVYLQSINNKNNHE
jgi:hypothetical protein